MNKYLNNPKLTIQFEGKQKIRDAYLVEYFSPEQSYEQTLLLNQDSGFIPIYTSGSGFPVRKVVIEAPVFNPNNEQLYSIELKTTVQMNPSGQIDFIEEIEANTIKSYSESFGSRITRIEIKSTSQTTNTKKVQCKVYCYKG